MLRSAIRPCVLGALLATWGALLVSAEPPRPEDVAQAIKNLGSDRFKTREEASAFLWKAGKAAEEALRQAAASGDAEVARRAKAILDRFKWGLYPDTPREIADAIDRYRGGDVAQRRQVVQELLAKGGDSHQLLRKFAQAEEDENARLLFWEGIAEEVPDLVHDAILADKLDLAEEVLAFATQTQDRRILRDYVALLYLRGRVDDRIARLGPMVAKGTDPEQARLLAFLHRAKGDLEGAVAAAQATGDAHFVTSLLLEKGDWPQLARRAEGNQGMANLATDELERLGFQLAFQRLAGEKDKADETVEAVQNLTRVLAAQEPLYVWLAAKVLLVNERPDAALGLLKEHKQVIRAMEVLMAQLRFTEALALADEADTPSLRLQAKVAKGRALYLVGEKEEALRLFGEVAATAAGNGTDDLEPLQYLFETERRLKLTSLLHEHASKLLSEGNLSRHEAFVLNVVFPNQYESAGVWFAVLGRRQPAPGPLAKVQKTAAILNGKLPPAETRELARDAEKWATRQPPDERQAWLITLADAYLGIKQDDDAERCLRAAAALDVPGGAGMRLGDFLAERKRWDEAAEAYERCWERDRHQVTPLHLRGVALTQAGKTEEGRKLIEQSRWLSLASEDHRTTLAAELTRRRRAEEARAQRNLILRLGDPEADQLLEAHRQLALDALSRGEHAAVADGFERYALICLRNERQMAELETYFLFSQWIRERRALAKLAEGKPDAAARLGREAAALFPHNVEVAIELSNALIRAGRQEDADALYQGVRQRLVEVCKNHPKCATHRNALAWLMACGKRDLDEALSLAQEAVRLEPKTPAYLDTLAEIHFQRGNAEQAIALIQQCIELDATRVYYQQQWKRFKAGDRQAPIPREDGDE